VKADPTFWYLARASGLLAYALLTGSVLAGLVLKARPFDRLLRPAAITDFHRFVALLGLGSIAIHGAALLHDTTVKNSPLALYFPRLVPYRPHATALGTLAALGMLLVYVSFPLRKRIGARNWRRLHWLTYGVFALATVHGLAAGSSTHQAWALALYGAATGAVIGATAWRILVPPTRGGNRRVPDRDRPLPV
jgi:predicted ferric reductase